MVDIIILLKQVNVCRLDSFLLVVNMWGSEIRVFNQ